jgi:polyferredoxin
MKNKNIFIKSAIVIILALIFITLFGGQQYIQCMLSTKHLLYLVAAVTAIILLNKKRVSTLVRIISLAILFIVFGVLTGLHPSPLCALTKPFTAYQIMGFIPPPMIIMAGAMILFTVIGNKIFCGWICPLGCLQEVIHKLSSVTKKFKFPFIITNSVRFSLLAVFITVVLFFSVNIFNWFNPFELFHWRPNKYILIVTSIIIVASLFYYRPFCQFLCPAGFITWIFEHTSLFRIHKSEDKCTHCTECIKESPCNAIHSIINNHTITPDCYACGKCIESCPENALSFSLKSQ